MVARRYGVRRAGPPGPRRLALGSSPTPSFPAAALPRGTLPAATPKTTRPPWSRDEAQRLISAPSLDADRRVLWALCSFTGMRIGEAAGRRWRDVDTEAEPLWALDVRTQYEGRETKTRRARLVPIHAELRRILEAWKRDGWPMLFGRHPTPDDFIVPNSNPDPRYWMRCHTKSSAGKQLARDLERIGVERSSGQLTHSFRRFFITYTRRDGARRDVVEQLTHNASGEIIDAYTLFDYGALCEAVSCLQLERLTAEVIALPVAIGDAPRSTPRGGPSGPRGGVSARASAATETREITRTLREPARATPCSTPGASTSALAKPTPALGRLPTRAIVPLRGLPPLRFGRFRALCARYAGHGSASRE